MSIPGPVYCAPTYTITDAQADAAVLTALDGFLTVGVPVCDMESSRSDRISDAILNRLHAFYCGEGEK